VKQLVILGAGTAGTMMANHLARKLDRTEWSLTIVDEHTTHYYQPGFLFIPFGTYTEDDVRKPKTDFIPGGVRLVREAIDLIEHENNEVHLKSGDKLAYDILIVATGAKIVPGETEGMLGDGWRRDIFDFYTIEGAVALRERLKDWKGGRLVVHLNEMPVKCPVAPLEFTLLAEAFLTDKGVREETEIRYLSPLSEPFTKHNCALVLGDMLDEKRIEFVPDFQCESIDAEGRKVVSYDEKAIDYDLLVTIPTNMGDPCIERSGLGDDLNFIPTHVHTLQSKEHDNIFVIGDATDLPSSKAGSVAHFQAETLTENIQRFIRGQELEEGFDGHANCFIESGHGKAFLIDFNYEVEPLEGSFPVPGIGPFKLLKETRINHLGKLAFRWMYWNLLLKGIPMPGISTNMSMVGKKAPR
jgi:sulfide:quinone oxidoreductase